VVRNLPNNSVPDMSDVPLDAFVVGEGVDCDCDDAETADELEEGVEGAAVGNVRVGEEDARLQNCWSSFSSVVSSVGQSDSIQANTSEGKVELTQKQLMSVILVQFTLAIPTARQFVTHSE